MHAKTLTLSSDHRWTSKWHCCHNCTHDHDFLCTFPFKLSTQIYIKSLHPDRIIEKIWTLWVTDGLQWRPEITTRMLYYLCLPVRLYCETQPPLPWNLSTFIWKLSSISFHLQTQHGEERLKAAAGTDRETASADFQLSTKPAALRPGLTV